MHEHATLSATVGPETSRNCGLSVADSPCAVHPFPNPGRGTQLGIAGELDPGNTARLTAGEGFEDRVAIRSQLATSPRTNFRSRSPCQPLPHWKVNL